MVMTLEGGEGGQKDAGGGGGFGGAKRLGEGGVRSVFCIHELANGRLMGDYPLFWACCFSGA